MDKAIPASIENSLKLVVGNRDQEFKLAGAPIGNRVTARWTGASIQGWTATARIPVSLVRTNPPRFLTANKKDRKLEVVWQEPPGLVSGADKAVNLHMTTSTTVDDYAAATNNEALARPNLGGVDLAAGWVNLSKLNATTRYSYTGLVNGRKYRFRVRYGFVGANGVIAYGAWAHGSATPRATPPTIVRSLPETCRPPNADEIQAYLDGGTGREAKDTPCVPVASCLTGLEIKGVRANGTKTKALPLLGTGANFVGLGGPGFYAIRVPPAVKKVEIKPEWTNQDSLGISGSMSDVTGSFGFVAGLGWGLSDSGTAKEFPLRPGSGVTRIYMEVTATGCTEPYIIYAYHDNFADSANANLRTLQMNAGN